VSHYLDHGHTDQITVRYSPQMEWSDHGLVNDWCDVDLDTCLSQSPKVNVNEDIEFVSHSGLHRFCQSEI